MTTTTFKTTSTTTTSISFIILLYGIVSIVGLLAFPVHAAETSSSSSPSTMEFGNDDNTQQIQQQQEQEFWERILSGPIHWTIMDKIVFFVLIMMGMELLGWSIRHSGDWMNSKKVPVRGKHLDVLTFTDQLYIVISKIQTGPFVYFFLRYLYSEPNILWHYSDLSIRTVLLPLPVIFIVFDFFYTALHWALHIKSIYAYVHKHHHIQKAPSRANDDAINVHPLEFFLGEYNHLWSWFLCCKGLGLRVHALGGLVYLIIGGVLAGWNHTRFDVVFSLLGVTIFDSKIHDVHHRIPQSNYGQYTVFWDYIFGTYRPYDPKDRVNPNAQLDPKTGQSIEYVNSKNLKEQ